MILFIGLTTGLFAQNYLGLRAGLNFASVNITSIELDEGPVDLEKSPITGANFAVFSQLGISSSFAIQPELTYLQKGVELKASEDDIENVQMRVNYLELPVLAKMLFGQEGVRANLFAGPSVGYAMNGKIKFNIEGTKFTEDIDFGADYDEDGTKPRRMDLGGVVGGGLEIGSGKSLVLMDVRYGLGFSDVTKYRNGRPNDIDKHRNAGLGLTLGYKFTL